MSKQTTQATNATVTKSQQKTAPTPIQEVVAAPEMGGLFEQTGMSSFQDSASQLNDPNLQRIQRQMMANRLGQQQGNSHLGQVMAFVRQNQPTAPSQPNKIQTIRATPSEKHLAEAIDEKQSVAPMPLEIEHKHDPIPNQLSANSSSPVSYKSFKPLDNPSSGGVVVQRGIGDFVGNALEGAKSLGSRALSGLQRLGSGVLSRLQQLGSGVVEKLEQMGEAAVVWGPRIAQFVANPVAAFTGTLWLSFPSKIKLLLIDKVLEYSDAIFSRLRSGWVALIGPIWPLIGSFMSGFIRRMSQVHDKEKVTLSDKLASIMRGGSLTFLWGVIKGLSLGLWDVIKMPYDLVVGLIDGIQFIGKVLSRFGLEAIQAGASMVAEALPAAFDGLRQMIMNPRRAVRFLQIIWDSISGAISRVGEGLAGALLRFVRLPDDQMGEQVGRLASEFAVDALLAVFTAGTGALIRRGAAIVRRFMAWFRRGGRAVGKMVRMIRSAIEPLLSGTRRIGQLFRGSRFGGWMNDFGRWLNQLWDSVGDVARRGRRGTGQGRSGRRAIGEAADDVGDASRRGRRVGNDVAENAKEYAKAKAITAANEQMGTPTPALIRLLLGRFPSRRFRAVPLAPGHSRIIMRAVLDNDYKPANPDKVINVLSDFRSRTMRFGNETFVLDKRGMKHMLERHHPDFWDGSTKTKQSFFDNSPNIDELANTIGEVMNRNRDLLFRKGSNGMYQLPPTEIDGITYILGINNGRVGQFYPL